MTETEDATAEYCYRHSPFLKLPRKCPAFPNQALHLPVLCPFERACIMKQCGLLGLVMPRA
jgi:hypothetical protein